MALGRLESRRRFDGRLHGGVRHGVREIAGAVLTQRKAASAPALAAARAWQQAARVL